VKVQTIKELPLLSETPMLKREALFKQKLQQCCILFNFEDETDADMKGKEIKRETLVELAEYVNTPIGQKIYICYISVVCAYYISSSLSLPISLSH
jgi:serine/threonine-protein phosphatase 2A regulatory subunit B'